MKIDILEKLLVIALVILFVFIIIINALFFIKYLDWLSRVIP